MSDKTNHDANPKKNDVDALHGETLLDQLQSAFRGAMLDETYFESETAVAHETNSPSSDVRNVWINAESDETLGRYSGKWLIAALALIVVSLCGFAVHANNRRQTAEKLTESMAEERVYLESDRAELLDAVESQIKFRRIKDLFEASDVSAARSELEGVHADSVQRSFTALQLTNPVHQFVEQERMQAGEWPIVCSAWSPDNTRLLSADHGGQLRLTDFNSRKSVLLDRGYVDTETNTSLHWIQNQSRTPETRIKASLFVAIKWIKANTAYVATLDGKVFRVDPTKQDQQEFKEIAKVEKQIHAMDVSEDGKMLLVGTVDGEVLSIDSLEGSNKSMTISSSAVTAVHYYGLTDSWLVGTDGGDIVAIDSELENVIAKTELDNRIWSLDVSKSGLIAAGVAEQDPVLLALNDKALSEVARLTISKNERVDANSIEFYGENSVVASGPKHRVAAWKDGRLLSVWTSSAFDKRLPASMQLKLPIPFQRHIGAVHWESENRFGLTDHSGVYRRFYLEDGNDAQVAHWKKEIDVGMESEVVFDPNSAYLWALNIDGFLSLIDVNMRKIVDQVQAHVPLEPTFVESSQSGQTPRRTDIRSDSEIVATAARSKTIGLWRQQNGKIEQIRKIQSEEPILSIDVSTKAGLVAAVDCRAYLIIWELTGRKIFEERIPGSNSPMCPRYGALRFNSNGKLLAVTGVHQDTRVFETATQKFTDDYIDVSGAGASEVEWSGECDLLVTYDDLLVFRTHYTDERRARMRGESDRFRRLVRPQPRLGELVDIDFVPGSGFVSLFANGEVVFNNSKHFFETGSWKIPFDDCLSLDVSNDQSWLAAARRNGLISLVALDNVENEKQLTIVTRSLRVEQVFSSTAANLYPKWDVDSDGHPYGLVFELKGRSEGGGKLSFFEFTSNGWALDPLEIEPDDQWPVPGGGATNLWRDGDEVQVVYRRRRPDIGQYAFDSILAIRDADGWSFESVSKNWNAGQHLAPFRDSNGQLLSFTHHSPAGYPTFVSKRGDQTDVGWPRIAVRPHQVISSTVRTDDKIHGILTPRRFVGDPEPPRYVIWDGETRFEELLLPKGASKARLHSLPDGTPLVEINWQDTRRKCGWFVREESGFTQHCPDFGSSTDTFSILPNGELAVVTNVGGTSVELQTRTKVYRFSTENPPKGESILRGFKIDTQKQMHLMLSEKTEDGVRVWYGRTEPVDW